MYCTSSSRNHAVHCIITRLLLWLPAATHSLKHPVFKSPTCPFTALLSDQWVAMPSSAPTCVSSGSMPMQTWTRPWLLHQETSTASPWLSCSKSCKTRWGPASKCECITTTCTYQWHEMFFPSPHLHKWHISLCPSATDARYPRVLLDKAISHCEGPGVHWPAGRWPRRVVSSYQHFHSMLLMQG